MNEIDQRLYNTLTKFVGRFVLGCALCAITFMAGCIYWQNQKATEKDLDAQEKYVYGQH